MPRRSSSGRSGGGYGRSYGGGGYRTSSYSRPSSSSPRYSNSSTNQRTAMPHTSHQNTMPINQQRGMGLGGTLATGMAFGGGSAIGHTLMGGLMGNRGGYYGEVTPAQSSEVDSYKQQSQQVQQQQEINKNPCTEFAQRFVECLKTNSDDISKCQNIMEDLKMCEKFIS